MEEMVLLACPSALDFSKKVSDILSIPLCKANFYYFANGEVKTTLLESVRGKDVYIFCDVENHYIIPEYKKALSINDNLLVLLTTIDSVRQSSAAKVTIIIPAFPYSRGHKKSEREGLPAKQICRMLETSGVNRVITLDIHAREIVGFFNNTILENLHCTYQIVKGINTKLEIKEDNIVCVAPDSGAVARTTLFANILKSEMAVLYKTRDYSQVSTDVEHTNITSMNLLGEVKGKNVILVDDMIGTGGTLLKAASQLKDKGASKLILAISLPLFSGKAKNDFDKAYNNNEFDFIVSTNAVYQPELVEKPWYVETDVSELFAKVISSINHGMTISDYLDSAKKSADFLHN